MTKTGHWTLTTLALTLLLVPAGCSSTQTTSQEIDDAAITTLVKAKLAADPEVNPFEIDVDTLDRVVYLRGTVDTPDERTEAEQLARRTDGVRGVVNELTIGERSADVVLNDARIASKVKAKLVADPEINPFEIDVDAKNGIVTLHGKVRTEKQRLEAASLARNTSGVKGVLNQIRISEGTGS